MRTRLTLAFAIVSALLADGCGSGDSKSGFGASPDAGGARASVDAAMAPKPPPPNLNEAGTGNHGGGCLTCSSDLHSVIGCDGSLVQTCAANEGCLPGGTCGPACASASANQSTIGCDYYSVNPDVIQGGIGQCFAAYVANTWDAPVSITVEWGGMTLDASGFARIPSGSGPAITYAALPGGQLPAGQVAILFLADFNAGGSNIALTCPTGITPAVTTSDAAVHGTAMGTAFHITTSAPVSAYDIYPYGGGQTALASATLLLPTSAWDTNYIAVDAFTSSVIAQEAGAQPTLDIVAQEDGTTVTISPVAAIVGGTGVAPANAGALATYSLTKGQVLQFTQQDELTGSAIQANKPIGVWGGASCLNIDTNTCCCDAAHQEVPPVKALGYEYVGVIYRNRDDTATTDETPPWRFVGAVDGTDLTYDPAPPPGAPLTLSSGQLVQFNASGPFVVKSQDDKHPFYVSAHMSGCETYFGPEDCRGDPEYVNVVPAQQYLSSYVFFTDPTYPETNLVIVRTKGSSGFADVSLDCAGTLAGWKPVGTSGAYEYTRIDLVRHDFDPQGGCNNGRHEIKSTAPFGVTVWGWGSAETGGIYGDPGAGGFFSQAVSYAYPAGMSVKPINSVVIVPEPK
jgi:IgGFc binding protein